MLLGFEAARITVRKLYHNSVIFCVYFLEVSSELFGFISGATVLQFWQLLEYIRLFVNPSISVLASRRSNRDRICMAGNN